MGQFQQSDTWQHADWTNGFRCGATTYFKPQPSLSLTENVSSAASFPALFSSWDPSFGNQKPLAYLCYAERLESCQAQAHPEDSVHFEEPMACPGPVQRKWFASAWRNISGPRPIPSTNWRESISVTEFRAVRGNDGDCAQIWLHARGIGSQVVFALECNVSAYVDTDASTSGGLSGHDGPGIACPEGDRVRLAVESAAAPRGALVVYPEANATSATRYTFESKQQTVLVSPGSTLIVVVDRSSGSMNVSLCF